MKKMLFMMIIITILPFMKRTFSLPQNCEIRLNAAFGNLTNAKRNLNSDFIASYLTDAHAYFNSAIGSCHNRNLIKANLGLAEVYLLYFIHNIDVREDRLSRAIEFCTQAYQIDSNSIECNRLLGMIYFYRNEIQSARNYLQRAIELDQLDLGANIFLYKINENIPVEKETIQNRLNAISNQIIVTFSRYFQNNRRTLILNSIDSLYVYFKPYEQVRHKVREVIQRALDHLISSISANITSVEALVSQNDEFLDFLRNLIQKRDLPFRIIDLIIECNRFISTGDYQSARNRLAQINGLPSNIYFGSLLQELEDGIPPIPSVPPPPPPCSDIIRPVSDLIAARQYDNAVEEFRRIVADLPKCRFEEINWGYMPIDHYITLAEIFLKFGDFAPTYIEEKLERIAYESCRYKIGKDAKFLLALSLSRKNDEKSGEKAQRLFKDVIRIDDDYSIQKFDTLFQSNEDGWAHYYIAKAYNPGDYVYAFSSEFRNESIREAFLKEGIDHSLKALKHSTQSQLKEKILDNLYELRKKQKEFWWYICKWLIVLMVFIFLAIPFVGLLLVCKKHRQAVQMEKFILANISSIYDAMPENNKISRDEITLAEVEKEIMKKDSAITFSPKRDKMRSKVTKFKIKTFIKPFVFSLATLVERFDNKKIQFGISLRKVAYHLKYNEENNKDYFGSAKYKLIEECLKRCGAKISRKDIDKNNKYLIIHLLRSGCKLIPFIWIFDLWRLVTKHEGYEPCHGHENLCGKQNQKSN